MNTHILKTFSIFDLFLIIGVSATSIGYAVLTKEFDILGTIAAISGLLCVVLVAKRSIYNYIFGIINVSLYAYISFKSELYGDALLNALYYVPMQGIGLIIWLKKKDAGDSSKVKAKKMSTRQRLLWTTISAVSIIVGGFILKYIGDPQPFKDAATTFLSIIAMYLMVRTYMEQWVLWIIVNIISIVIWVIASINGVGHSGLMIIMWCFYLANSINGFYIWNKQSKIIDGNN